MWVACWIRRGSASPGLPVVAASVSPSPRACRIASLPAGTPGMEVRHPRRSSSGPTWWLMPHSDSSVLR